MKKTENVDGTVISMLTDTLFPDASSISKE
jgi:hypothetical protein